jgi:hypothetical protein
MHESNTTGNTSKTSEHQIAILTLSEIKQLHRLTRIDGYIA